MEQEHPGFDKRLFLGLLGAQIAAIVSRLLAHPWQTLDAMKLPNAPAIQQLAATFQLPTPACLQDLANCITLSECVYKAVDFPIVEAVHKLNEVKLCFPGPLVSLSSVQWSLPHVRHRYMVAESPDVIYVACMGTKVPQDIIANVSFWLQEVSLGVRMLSGGDEAVGDGKGTTKSDKNNMPAAHRGFLDRARAIPVDSLYAEARAKGKRLVFTGHSLGGAVSQLCALQLLHRVPAEERQSIACYTFATPPLANQALSNLARESGWDATIYNFILPEDPIPKLLSRNYGGARDPRLNQDSIAEKEENNNIKPFSVLPRVRLLGLSRKSGKSPLASSTISSQPEQDTTTNSLTRMVASTARQVVVPIGFVATAPMRAAPDYKYLGKRLYLLADGVTEDPVVAATTSTTSSLIGGKGAERATSAKRMITTWFVPRQSPSKDEGDDDLLDIAAASALENGGLAPEKPPRSTLFSMHRMVSYRRRVIDICRPVFGDSSDMNCSSLPAYIPASLTSSPTDVIPSEILGPLMYPVKAAAVSATHIGNPVGGPSVDAVVRIEGKGLSNLEHAWITDWQGKSMLLDILVKPEPPALETVVKAPAPNVTATFTDVISWVSAMLGWHTVLAKLQPPGSRDFVLAKVKMSSKVFSQANVHMGGSGLQVHLISDFSKVSLPLEIGAAGK